MKPVNRRWFQRLADIAIPWGVGLFYVLVVLGDEYDERVPTGIGLLLAVLQGAALRWRRSHPELVMVAALAGGVAFWLLAPKVVIPFAGLLAIYSLAAARRLR